MQNAEALIDMHDRAHQNLKAVLAHCSGFGDEDLNCEFPGFGYPCVRLQLHHEIGAEKYWIGVIQGRIDVDEDAPEFASIESLMAYRKKVYTVTDEYLLAASLEDLNTPRMMKTWGNREKMLVPAHVILRTITHLYHHQGQIAAMCRLLGKPSAGWDFPLQ